MLDATDTGDGAANEEGRARVLIVDDEDVTAQAVAKTVRRLGHDAEVVNTWTDALRAFDPLRTDLILMDAVMPGVDGFKLTRLLRSRSDSYVPIVFLTGLTDHDAKRACVAAGADDFLPKPVDELELSLRLTAMLRIRSLTRRLEAQTVTLDRMARFDALTGVGNRRTFEERLASEIARSRRHHRPLALLMMDLDHFKQVNDDFGHGVGDELLATFGRMLSDITRSCDFPCRYGGEEFAVIATETRTVDAIQLGERIRMQFRERSRMVSAGGPRSVSIGVCGSDVLDCALGADELKEAADTALYRAKHLGRDRVVQFRPSLRLQAV